MVEAATSVDAATAAITPASVAANRDTAAQVRIAIVVQLPFSEIDFPKYEIADLLRLGVHIEIVDVSRLMFPENGFKVPKRFWPDGVHYHPVATKRELAQVREVVDGVDLVIQAASTGHVSPQSVSVIRFFSRLATPYALIYRNAIPNIDLSVTKPTLAQRLQRFNFGNFVLNRIPLGLLGIRPADYVIRGGTASRIPMRLVDKSTREIWSVAECVRAVQDAETALAGAPPTATAVYLDQYFAFHPDELVRTNRTLLDPEKIYPPLRRAFDAVERQLGLEVVVAAHPRAERATIERLFGNRRIVFGKTAELVGACRLVLCCYSTSVNFAVAFRKPVTVMKMREFEKLPTMADAPESLAAAIGTRVVRLDGAADPDFSDALQIDQAAYDTFMERYIRTDRAAELSFAEQIVALCRAPKAPAGADG